MNNFLRKDEIGLMYPLESPYRLHRLVSLNIQGKITEVYGHYMNGTVNGMKDYDSWEDIVNLWTPDAKIFAKLPVRDEDLGRAIKGEKRYLVDERTIYYEEENDIVTSRFRNVREEEAKKLIEELIEQECPANRYNVGLELTPSLDEIELRDRNRETARQKEIQDKIDNLFRTRLPGAVK